MLIRLTAHVEQLWSEWEIQLLVLLSFVIQVFLLLFSGTRKRTTSGVLRGFLWLAAYVVGKQWQGDKQLLAPMVLMFLSGTLKYAGRTSALMLVAKEITPRGIGMLAKGWSAKATDYSSNVWMMDEKQTYQELLWNAHAGLALCLAFLMDNTPLKSRPVNFPLQGLLSKGHRVHISYKLAELQLRIIYDYCYTKIGMNAGDKGNKLNGWFPKLVTLGCTFTALILFSRADQRAF
jgi:hypothetical protein